MTAYILRNAETKKIESYYLTKQDLPTLKANVEKFNAEPRDKIAEVVESYDLISLIEIAEQNKNTKLSQLKDIEDSIESLRND